MSELPSFLGHDKPALRRYRTKPVEVEAIQYTAETCAEVHRLLGQRHECQPTLNCASRPVLVNTPSEFLGRELIELGRNDWLILYSGEWSVDPNGRFRAKYEEV